MTIFWSYVKMYTQPIRRLASLSILNIKKEVERMTIYECLTLTIAVTMLILQIINVINTKK